MNQISRFFYNHIGILSYRKDAIPIIIINRITRRLTGKVFCSCGQFVSWNSCWGVCTDDCILCVDCMCVETDGDYCKHEDYPSSGYCLNHTLIEIQDR